MATTERPVLVAVITTMGVIIAALITSGYLTRSSAARREDALEARVRFLEAQLRQRSGAGNPNGAGHPEPDLGGIAPAEPSEQLNATDLAKRLAQEKNTEILSPAHSVKGVMADNATKEYIFVGNGNVPLLFSLAQPDNNFWSEIDILNSLGAPVLRGEGFSDHSDEFSFTPPKDDAYVIRVRGTRKFGSFVIGVAPLATAK